MYILLVLPAVALVIFGCLRIFSWLDKTAPLLKPVAPVLASAKTGGSPHEGKDSPITSKAKDISPSQRGSAPIRLHAGVKPGSRAAVKPNPGSKDSRSNLPSISQSEGKVEPAGGISMISLPAVQEQASPQRGNGAATLLPASATPAPASAAADTSSQAAAKPAAVNAVPSVAIAPAENGTHEPAKNADDKVMAEKPERSSVPAVISAPAESIVKVQPTYPDLARKQKVTGVVELEAYVDEKGNVTHAKAVAGPMLLRIAAEEALLKWKFRPASVNGVNIASQAQVRMIFSMK
jgi:TonB family protein